ncbi:MAG: hypothetical protein EOP52_11405 [Sphingobacteriales bacterium]|nr:MAG: hypothetical protein EOP52_11405 [Sphingobacteriales bacterium]
MLPLIRNNTPYAVGVLLILVILIGASAPVAAVAVPPVSQPLYYFLIRSGKALFGTSAFGWTTIYLLLLFGQALYLNNLVIRHRLFTKSTFTPAFMFLIFATLLPSFQGITPPLFANFLLLGALDTMLQFGRPTQPRRLIFNAGFLIGTAAFVQFSYVFAFGLLLAALLFLRPFHTGEYMAALLGLLTPVYFMATALFLTDQLSALRNWPSIALHRLPWHSGQVGATIGIYSGVALLLLAGLYQLNGQMNRSSIYVRRSWGVIVSGMVISVFIAVLAPATVPQSWRVLAPFYGLVVAAALETEKPRRFATFAFWMALALPIASYIFL